MDMEVNMSHIPSDRLQGFDLLTPLAISRLHERIARANNNIPAVADEIGTQLAALDQVQASDDDALRALHADRAYLLAQQTYLAQLERVTLEQAQPE
jgi:hypothetical protein